MVNVNGPYRAGDILARNPGLRCAPAWAVRNGLSGRRHHRSIGRRRIMRPLLTTAALLLFVAYAPADPQKLADRIDAHLDARFAAEKVKPAPPADDAEFLRRASLDITGRIPTPRAVHDFLANTDPYKRAKLIDEL